MGEPEVEPTPHQTPTTANTGSSVELQSHLSGVNKAISSHLSPGPGAQPGDGWSWTTAHRRRGLVDCGPVVQPPQGVIIPGVSKQRLHDNGVCSPVTVGQWWGPATAPLGRRLMVAVR